MCNAERCCTTQDHSQVTEPDWLIGVPMEVADHGYLADLRRPEDFTLRSAQTTVKIADNGRLRKT
jgi:hypothetical protein